MAIQKFDREKIEKLADLAGKLSDKAVKEDFTLEFQRTVHLIRQHDLVGAIIARAMANGDFDNLEGAGKPLNLDENPFEPEELRMAHRILKENGYAPHWIELHKEIDVLKARLNKDVENLQKYTRIFYREKRSSLAMRHYENKKNRACIQIRELLQLISRKILEYNVNCPVLQLTKANINIDDEMIRIVREIEALS